MTHGVNHALGDLRSARTVEKRGQAIADAPRQGRELAAAELEDVGGETHLRQAPNCKHQISNK
jgi:hypothetical protein